MWLYYLLLLFLLTILIKCILLLMNDTEDEGAPASIDKVGSPLDLL